MGNWIGTKPKGAKQFKGETTGFRRDQFRTETSTIKNRSKPIRKKKTKYPGHERRLAAATQIPSSFESVGFILFVLALGFIFRVRHFFAQRKHEFSIPQYE